MQDVSNEIAPGFSISNVLAQALDRKVIRNGCISDGQALSPNDLLVAAENNFGVSWKAKFWRAYGQERKKKRKKRT